MESAHQLSFRADCNNTAEVPSFTLRTALSAIPFVSDLCGVDFQWFWEEIFTNFAKFQRIVSVNDFQASYLAPGTFASYIVFPEKVFVLHGYDWIHWVTKSCTTIAYRWLFRDSQFSLRTLWSAVIKSPKFFCTRYDSANASSARDPCDVGPLADLAISVFRETSIKTVLAQILTSLE